MKTVFTVTAGCSIYSHLLVSWPSGVLYKGTPMGISLLLLVPLDLPVGPLRSPREAIQKSPI